LCVRPDRGDSILRVPPLEIVFRGLLMGLSGRNLSLLIPSVSGIVVPRLISS
jgi:hypothetical protein